MSDQIAPVVGLTAAVLGTLCWLPQLARTLRTRMVRDISLWTTILLMTTMALWLTYGILLGSFPIILANTLSLTAVGVLLVAKLLWGRE